MLRKLLIGVCVLIVGVGIFLLMGTVGASDNNLINTATTDKQLIVSILLIAVGTAGLKLNKWEC